MPNPENYEKLMKKPQIKA